eukprot:TRINITY_DN4686_c0_g1_i6.p1 TRINITY_DN4686_c0_g1~~TRINITY_DN4686_c0_g1_i6.p1  ORF type:complete len:2396 (+),score=381.83 TRINITY_DN4686_c0_g1_i6:977-7189(+)
MAVNLDNLEIERRKQSMLDSKTTLPILRPMQSSQHFPVSLGDKILLISGGLPVSPQNPATLQAPSNEVWVFNPQNWSWMNSSVWLQPFPRALSSIALKDSNSLLVFGGVIFRPSFLDINDLWEYNRATQKWKRLWIESQDGANSSPKPTQRASMGYFDGSVYVIGGGNVGSILQYTAHRFVIESKTWSLLKISYNHEYSAAYRYGIATLSVGGRLYLIGGQRNAALPFNNTEYDNYVLDMTKSSLEILEASNRVMNRLMASVFAYEDRICIFGGIKNNAWSRTTECLNTTTKVWEELFGGEQSSSNVQLLTTTFMGQVIEFGGYDISTDKLQSDIYLYDAISGGMNQKPKLAFYPPPIYAHSAIAYKTSLYIFGGIGYYSFVNPHIFELDTRNLFCSGFTTISVSLGRIQPVTDGSGDNGYLLSTNCIFSITGANRIWVNEIDVLTGEVTLELRKSALLQQIALDSEGGILWNSNEQMGLDNQFHQKTLAFYQEEANITFSSADEGITKAGFNFVVSFCPFGWMFDGTSCYCPVEHFINIQGSCLKCPFVFNGVSTSMNQTTCFVREIPNNGFEMMEESDYPPPAEGPCIGSVNGKIFLTGGKRFSEAKIDNRFIYNNMESIYKLSHPISADWIRLRASGEIPTRREFGCFIGHEGSLLLIGGITEKLDHAVYEINPNELVWRKKNYSLDVLTPTCGSYLNSVYVYGTNSAQEKIFFRISSRGELSQLVSECPDCPTSGRMPGGVIGSSFYLLSVHKIQNGGVVCHRFDLESSAWSSFLVSKAEFRQETSYSPITNAGYATFNDTIHVFGGLDSNSNPTRQYLVFFPATRKFVSIAAEAYKDFSGTLRTPPPLHGVSGVYFENSVFFYGGVTGSNGLITSEAWSFDPDKLVWQQSSAAMYPSQRSHFAVATVGNVVYLYSGKTKSFPSVPFGELWEYDLVKKYWSLHICNQAKCPPPLEGSIMTLFGDKLLLIGGRSESTKNIANYWSLSTDGKQSRVWIDRFDSNIRGSHPFGRYGHSFCQNSSHLYIWGGRDLDESEASYDAIFLIGADSSLSRTRVFNSMPVTRMYFTMSLHNNSLYIFGGMRLSGSFLSDLWRYDLNLNSWQLLTPQGSVPSLSGAMSFVQPEYWLILGGEMTAGQEEQGNAWMYQFESNSWIPLIIETNELPLLPAYGGAWWTDNNIHIFGGVFETLELNKIMEYTPEICRESPTEIVGTGTFSTFHDGSGPGKYMTNMTCRWRLLDATRLIVHANMAQGDTLVVREYKDSLDSGKVIYLHEGNAIDSISPSLLSSTGFAVTFVSARKATRLSGNGFTVFYQVCRGEVSFDSIEGCECASGFYHDTERSACTKCETSSDGRTCHTENSPHKFIVIISSAAGVFVVIMMAVFFLYRRRSKRRMDQTKKKNLISIKYSELTITSLLGSGGFGEVYLAEWRGSEVAVKKLIKQDISEQDLQAFYHEMDTMVQLRHPNILLYMGACLEKSKLCIVCEFMQQGTLYDALHNPEIEMDFQRRIDFIKSIATGMQFLHAAEPPILHRDLKTPNLLIDGKFTIKISDFGLAAVKAQGMNGLGSLMWLAPEVINDGNYEAPADVFSFGIITWEILMRKNLYEHLESPLAVAVYVCRGVRPNIPPDMPQDLKDIVVQSWDNKPEKRPTFAKILETVKLIANDKSEAMSSYFSLKASKLVPKATEKDVAILAIFVTGLDEYYADIPDIFSEVFKGYHAKLSQLLSRFQVVTLGSGDTDYIAFSDSNSVIDFCTQFQTDLMNGNWPAEFMEYNQQRNQTTSYAGLLLQFGASYGTVHKDRQESERAVFFGKEMKLSGRLAAQAAPGTIYASGAFKDSIEESTNDGHMWERATPFGLGIPINTKVFSLIIFDFEKKFPIQNPASKIIYSYHYASPAEILLMEGDDVTLGDQSSNPASHQSYPVASPSTLPNQIDAQSSPISNSLREEPALNPKHADAAHSKGVSTKSQLQPLTMARSNIRNVSSRASLGTSAKLLWEINFDELVLEQESIGDGSYGTVYPAIYKVSPFLDRSCALGLLAHDKELYVSFVLSTLVGIVDERVFMRPSLM